MPSIEFPTGFHSNFRELTPTDQTWVARAIKLVVEYPFPIWHEKGFSGMIYSHAHIVIEMYEQTNYEENKFGFTGS